MQPSVGRIVHVLVDPRQNNGTDVAPGVVTRVWSDTCVNLRVLLDGPDVQWLTSVPLAETRQALEDNLDRLVAEGVVSGDPRPRPNGAFWPPKT